MFNVNTIKGYLVRLPDEIHVDGLKWCKIYKLKDIGYGAINVPVGIEHVTSEETNEDIPEFTNYFQPTEPLNMSEDELANWYIDLFKKGLLK